MQWGPVPLFGATESFLWFQTNRYSNQVNILKITFSPLSLVLSLYFFHFVQFKLFLHISIFPLFAFSIQSIPLFLCFLPLFILTLNSFPPRAPSLFSDTIFFSKQPESLLFLVVFDVKEKIITSKYIYRPG